MPALPEFQLSNSQRHELPRGVDPGLDVDHAGRSEVRPPELLGAGPHQLDRTARRLRQPRRFDRVLAGVLSAVRRAGVGHDDADAGVGDSEGLGKLGADAEGTLRAGPDGELSLGPFGDGRARLQRHVRNVGNAIARFERSCGLDLGDVARGKRRRRPRAIGDFLEVIVNRRGGRLSGGRRPLRLDGGRRAARHAFAWRDHAGEIAVAHDRNTGHGSRAGLVERDKGRADSARPEDRTVQQSRPDDIRCVLMTAGDKRASIHLGFGLSARVPLRRGRDRGLGRNAAGELLSFRELAVGRRLAAGRNDPAVACSERRAIHLPLRGCLVDQHLASGRRRARELPPHARRALRPEGAGVVRRQVGVRHHHRNRPERQTQLVGDGLRKGRTDVLTDLGLAGVRRDASLLVDVQPCREVRYLPARLGAPPRFLCEHRRDGRHDDEAAAHDAEEITTLQFEPVPLRFAQLVPLGFDRVLLADATVTGFSRVVRDGCRLHVHDLTPNSRS